MKKQKILKKAITLLLTPLLIICGCFFISPRKIYAENPIPVKVKTLSGEILSATLVSGVEQSYNLVDTMKNNLVQVIETGLATINTGFLPAVYDFLSAKNIPTLTKANEIANEVLLNGGNKPYYVNQPRTITSNYNPITYNSTTNKYNVNYNYDNRQYTYNDIDIENTYISYDIEKNYYKYDFHYETTNYISISNTYNSLIVIDNGDTYEIFYKLPDGTDSFNLTEETAKKGYKTSLSVGTYNNNVDTTELHALYHFDNTQNNETLNNNTLTITPNSVQYVADETEFKNALALQNNFNITNSTNNKAYTFRIKPIINTNYNIKINNEIIGTTNIKYNTITNSEEYNINNLVKDNVAQGVLINRINYNNTYYYGVNGNVNYIYYYSENYINNTNQSFLIDYPSIYYSIDDYKSFINETYNNQINIENGRYVYLDNELIKIFTYDQKSSNYYIDRYTLQSSSNSKQFNFINNSYYESTGINNFINLNMWNYIYITKNGNIYINGIDTEYTIDNTENLNIEIESDSITYIDELAIFNEDRDNEISPNLPYSNNIYYTLPNNINNNELLLQTTISLNSYKFGGIRQTNATKGDVYINVDDYGYIKMCQIYDGINWIEVKGALYNKYLDLWITAVGFNIFNNNWEYVEEQYNVSTDDGNIFIRFFNNFQTKLLNKLDDILNSLRIVNLATTNEPDQETSNDINDYKNNVTDTLNEIDLDDPNANITEDNLTAIGYLVENTGLDKVVDVFNDNDLGWVVIAPMVIGLVGLIVL